MKINKTITFGAKDEICVEKLKSLGYLDKNFNFSRYVKRLIEEDIFKNSNVFTKEQEDRIIEIVRLVSGSKIINSQVIDAPVKEKPSFDTKAEVVVDKDDEELLDFMG